MDILLDLDLNLNEFCKKTDEELALLSKGKNNCNRAAGRSLIERYSKLIFIKAEIFSSHGSDTDDLRQEGLMGLLKAVASFDPGRGIRFSTFAETCIVNQMKSYCSRTAKKAGNCRSLDDIAEEDFPDKETPESIYINKEFFSELWNVVEKQLSDSEREVFMLYIGGMSYGSIAVKLGISEKSVDNAMQRARKKIRIFCQSQNH